jgi:hypothetical protein
MTKINETSEKTAKGRHKQKEKEIKIILIARTKSIRNHRNIQEKSIYKKP